MMIWFLLGSLLILNNSIYAREEINMFGTDGIRRIVSNSPFTIQDLPRLGRAIARWAKEKYGELPVALLGHDTRSSCDYVKACLMAGLLQEGVNVHDVGVSPTPTVCFLTKTNALFDFGIVISASHNAYQHNGVKVIDGNTIKLLPEDEVRISELYESDDAYTISYNQLGSHTYWHTAEQEYIDYVVAQFRTYFLRGRTIVLDCANGATHRLAPRIFKRCGARVITLHKYPNGININESCGSQHTERLQNAVCEYKADAGFAFDGDGDRVIAVDKNGVVKDGDDILALLMEHSRYKEEKIIVGTVMTNEAFRVFAHEKGRALYRTPVGDKYIAQKLEEENLLLGGEQAGHIILRDYLKSGDGIMTALTVMESIIINNNMDMKTFNHYPQTLINIPISVKKDLNAEPLSTIIKEHEQQLQNGRILVRYSGTENVIRVLVEDTEMYHTNQLAEHLAQALKVVLS